MQREGLQMSCQSVEAQTYRAASLHFRHLIKRQLGRCPDAKTRLDITYLVFGGKTLYLSSILDLFNGEICGVQYF